MRAFFVRPFGVKEGIDFDDVERALIRPALERLRDQHDMAIDGGTTGEFIRQGNIREDMFRLLVTADLVVADVSIHNPNAFYELGIRHALRHQHTFLLRAKATEFKYPFDLQTDRYFTYDHADLAGGVESLAAALRSTLNAESKYRDSPVFQLLPNLKPHDRSVLMPVPLDFQEDVKLAQNRGERGDLRLLAAEAEGFEWESEGLRLIGEAQFRIKAFSGAKETFETLRKAVPGDVRANLRLGTIYQKLAARVSAADKEEFLTRSDQAIRRALDGVAAPADRAEAFSLLGSNAKTRWLDDWRDVAADRRSSAALRSAHLADALDAYLNAYAADLTGYYPGVNALAMLKIQGGLAQRAPDAWEAAFDDPDKAAGALKDRDACAKRIAAALSLTLGIDPVFKVKQDEGDPWPAIARADVLFLTIDKPARIENEYRRALARVRNDPFAVSAARRNIEMFESLGLLADNVTTALGVIDEAFAATANDAGCAGEIVAGRTLHRAYDRQTRPATGKDAVPANRDSGGYGARDDRTGAARGNDGTGWRVARHRRRRVRCRHPVPRSLRLVGNPHPALPGLAARSFPGRIRATRWSGLGRALPVALRTSSSARAAGRQGASALAGRQARL